MAQSDRQYHLVVLGATGYTGKYTCEHVATALPTDLRWAVAGRSQSKLETLVKDLKSLNGDRAQPAIEIAQLQKDVLSVLASKTKVLISTIGPYHKYGTPVFEACAEAGTHYLDCTGEVPWCYDMINNYEATAKRTGAIMISQAGVESVPSDMMVWALASHIKHALGPNVRLREVVNSVYAMKAQASGGTLDTVLTLLDSYPLSHLAESGKPWALAPVKPQNKMAGRSLYEKITGLRYVPDLGQLTTSFQAAAEVPIVNRSWALLDQGNYYGQNFHVSILMRTRNIFTGFVLHLAITIGLVALALPPVRWFLRHFVYQPGKGPSKESTQDDHIEWRGIATVDVSYPNNPKRAFGRIRWQGSMYHLTGVTLAEAAITLLRDKTKAHEIGGGVMTPATLGAPYLERLQKAGLKAEFKMLP